MTPARYVATLRERWHPDGYSDAEIATWLIGESKGLLEDLEEDFIRQPTCTAVQEVTRYADFLSACVCLLGNRPRRGRPAEPAYVVDGVEFERHVIDLIRLIEKDGTPTSQPQLAQKLDISLRTFQRYFTRFHLDYGDVVRRARMP